MVHVLVHGQERTVTTFLPFPFFHHLSSGAPTTTTTNRTAAVVPVDDDDSVGSSFFSRLFGDAFARTPGSTLDSPRIPDISVYVQLSLNYVRVRYAGTALLFGASSADELGGRLYRPSPMRRRGEGGHEWEMRFGRTAMGTSYGYGFLLGHRNLFR